MYTIIWRYHVRASRLAEFEAAYGPEGDWVSLFTGKDGYVATQLFGAVDTPTTQLTIDTWRSKVQYDTFRATHATEYAEIDRRCEGFTDQEELLSASET